MHFEIGTSVPCDSSESESSSPKERLREKEAKGTSDLSTVESSADEERETDSVEIGGSEETEGVTAPRAERRREETMADCSWEWEANKGGRTAFLCPEVGSTYKESTMEAALGQYKTGGIRTEYWL